MYVMFYNRGSIEGLYGCGNVKINEMDHIWDLSKIHDYDVQRYFRQVIIRNKAWEKNIIFRRGLNNLLQGLYYRDIRMDYDPVHNIVLGDTYDIFDVKTVKKFYKYINFNADYVNYLGKYSNATEILDFLIGKMELKLEYSEKSIDNASEHGHMNVLEWFINNNLIVPFHYKLKYNIFVIKKSFSK